MYYLHKRVERLANLQMCDPFFTGDSQNTGAQNSNNVQHPGKSHILGLQHNYGGLKYQGAFSPKSGVQLVKVQQLNGKRARRVSNKKGTKFLTEVHQQLSCLANRDH